MLTRIIHNSGRLCTFLDQLDIELSQPHRVAIPDVQRKPGEGPFPAGSLFTPFAQQRGFVKTGRGGDEGQLAIRACIQPFNQAQAQHQLLLEGGYRVWSSAMAWPFGPLPQTLRVSF